jgi:UDP-N-acetylmuramoyl-tripeptide--D-alanyl-D-alanine ligase
MFQKFIQKRLEKYTRAYFAKHPEIKLIAVAGSVGKTTTKTMIATLLSQKYRVRMMDGNHNTHISAPVAMLGIQYPENVRSPIAWMKVFKAMKRQIKQPADVDIVIQELGTDGIGQIPHFGTYLRPAIGVVTAVTQEHMEFFGTIENVAQEELSLANYSELAFINRDDIDGRFAEYITDPAIDTYGTTAAAEYRFEIGDFDIESGYSGSVVSPEMTFEIPTKIKVFGEHSLRPVTCAVGVAIKLGLSAEEISAGVALIQPVHGRMNVLKGVDQSILIDDTYNSSPAAADAALRTLYSVQSPQRIAILGDMNELGEVSAVEHEKLGEFCDPDLLAWVITVGEQSERYLAPKARARGCQVKSFQSAIEAGAFANSVIEQGSVVLAKGSQGGIYLEEALKILLRVTSEDQELVRQSPAWMATKNAFFSK